jgi:hypothetical protein
VAWGWIAEVQIPKTAFRKGKMGTAEDWPIHDVELAEIQLDKADVEENGKSIRFAITLSEQPRENWAVQFARALASQKPPVSAMLENGEIVVRNVGASQKEIASAYATMRAVVKETNQRYEADRRGREAMLSGLHDFVAGLRHGS